MHRSIRTAPWLALLACALLLAGGPAGAQTAPQQREIGAPPRGVMWIGNSFFYYNNGIINHLRPMIAGARLPPVRNTIITISGSGFDWHDVDSYFRPRAVGRYSFGPQNTLSFVENDRIYDVAVLMDCSQCPVHPQLREVFFNYGRQHAETVRRHGARPVFFMSWAYADKPEMTAQLAEAYTTLGNETGALVIPAGLAFARALAQQPSLILYAADKRHPSLAGTYLAAAVSYAALFGASPEGLGYTAGLEPEQARFLRRVAWETVRAYYRR